MARSIAGSTIDVCPQKGGSSECSRAHGFMRGGRDVALILERRGPGSAKGETLQFLSRAGQGANGPIEVLNSRPGVRRQHLQAAADIDRSGQRGISEQCLRKR